MIKPLKFKTFFTLVFLLTTCTTFPADQEIPAKIKELEQKLNSLASREKVDLLNDLGKQYQVLDLQKSMDYGNKALNLSQKIFYNNGEAKALNNIGNTYKELGKHGQALEYHQKSLKIAESAMDKKSIALYLTDIGITYKNLGNYNQALEYQLRSLKIREEIGDKLGIASSLNNIGNIYNYLGKYDQVLEYYQKSLKILKEIGAKSYIAKSLLNIGVLYNYLGKYTQALEYHHRSLKMKEEMGDKTGVATCLLNIGEINKNLGKYNQALEYYQKYLQISKEIGINRFTGGLLVNIGNCYIKLGNYVEAEKYLHQSLKIAEEKKELHLISEIYKNLSVLYETQGDFQKSLKYYKLYYEANQNVFNEKNNKQINKLQENFNAEKREKEIVLLKKNEEIQALTFKKERATRNAFIIGLLFIFTILMLLFYKYLYLFAFWKKHAYVGQYRLMKKIGSGGFGTIYKAHNIRDKTNTVAVKILNEDIIDEANLRRFIKESEYIEKLAHPNIIKIYERGVDSKSNAKYIAMELLEGRPLSDIMQEKENKLPLKDSLHVMMQITDALVQIHSKGIIHRDIKPGNIMIINQDKDSYFVKLLDFGIAINNYETRLTKTGNFMGSENYVAPEQIKGNKAVAPSFKSDIFSLGIVFYELLTGKKPEDMNYRIMNDLPLADFIAADTVLPDSLINLIKAMLQKKPEDRPETQIVLQELQDILALIA